MLLAALLALLVPAAEACRCKAPPPEDDILKTRALAFIGRVVAERTLDRRWREYEFERLEVLKGALKERRVKVRTPLSSAACGQTFGIGRTYRVHARALPGYFFTGLCDYNREIVPTSQP